jgi:hypothetical protein
MPSRSDISASSNNSEQALESQNSSHKSSIKIKETPLLKAQEDLKSIESQTARKRVLQKILHNYQITFEKEHGRPIKSAADVGPLKNEYAEYKVLFT